MKKRLLLLVGVCALLDWVIIRTDHYARDVRVDKQQVMKVKKHSKMEHKT